MELSYIKIAKKYNIVDIPNFRSSHSVETIKGGGILIPLSLVLLYFLSDKHNLIIFGSLILGAISFKNDIKDVNPLYRFIVQLFVSSIALYDLSHLTLFSPFFIVVVFVYVSWINAFNFMDGINGISVIYSLAICTSLFFVEKMFYHQQLIIFLSIGMFSFGIFNFRSKAMVFLGDVGSTTVSYVLGYLIIFLIFETGRLEYILFLLVYGIDVCYTILERIFNGENIFKPHRQHLYQILTNEFGLTHITVSSIYALVQILINFLLLNYLDTQMINELVFCIIFLSMFTYFFIRLYLKNIIEARL